MSYHHPPLTQLLASFRQDHTQLWQYLHHLAEQFEQLEPLVQAFVPEPGRFTRLEQSVQALINQYPHPADRPPLFGLPLGVKDIFQVAGFPTRAGSQLPPERLAGPPAEVVRRLQAAGALIIGKTVTTEFAFFAPGPTRNPFNFDHTPGGSSSGSAAGVAADLCGIALGTQTIGSITRPAAFCGVVGYKPTYGRVSTAGVIPISPLLDHVGLLARSVADVQLVAPFVVENWQPAPPNLPRPVCAIPTGPYLQQASSEALSHFFVSCEQLRAAGYTIKELPAMADFEAIRARHMVVMSGEMAHTHAQWFAEFGALYHPKTAGLITQGQSHTPADITQAAAGRAQLRHELTELMDKHEVDLWLAPAAVGPAPAGLESTGDPVMSFPWTHSGLPTLNFPTSWSNNHLPLGVQVSGRWGSDEKLGQWGEVMAQVCEPTLTV